MLEHAANGQRYWTKELMLGYAAEAAGKRQQSLDKLVKDLGPDNEEAADGLFDRVVANLREGQVRLIFFLEDAPAELASIVDFLNKQMERSEVLLVEARQYRDGKLTVVVPTLYGYTEQARQVKKVVTTTAGARRKWDLESFFDELNHQLPPADVAVVRKVFDLAGPGRYGVNWGTGARRGSFGLK